MRWITYKQFIQYKQDISKQLKSIPISSEYYANRYDTDNEHVLHLWNNNESYNIIINKKNI